MPNRTTVYLQIGDLPRSGMPTCLDDGGLAEVYPVIAALGSRGGEPYRICDLCADVKIGKGATNAIRALNTALVKLDEAAPGVRAAVVTAFRPLLLDVFAGTLDAAITELIAVSANE
ncbi:hypothetical protein [Frankia sp. Cr1]|uniref:hypothetical protein n=1 Tax=Frankia sp. Cr1 TaxID=3073931 RepID=UPI002AD54E93|nr:hypothetical protein [Frankia sp. Cr1]